MKYAIISDIHANAEALGTVLQSIDRQHVDRIVCLGDLVGFHASPNECVEQVRARGIACVLGNHDAVAVGLKAPENFSPVAKHAIEWTQRELTAESAAFLREQPISRIIDNQFVIVHGAFHPHPNDETRVRTTHDATLSLHSMSWIFPDIKLGFFGHTHHCMVFARRTETMHLIEDEEDQIPLHAETQYLINPGSVGQPRGADWRAAYALLDLDNRTVRCIRVPYDRRKSAERAIAAGIMPPQPALARTTEWANLQLQRFKSIFRQRRALKWPLS